MARGMDRAGRRFRECVHELGSRSGMNTNAPTRYMMLRFIVSILNSLTLFSVFQWSAIQHKKPFFLKPVFTDINFYMNYVKNL